MKIYSFVKKMREGLLVYLTHQLALPLLKKIRKPEHFPYTTADLKTFLPGTVGNDLYCFLGKKSLELLPYYAKHDIKHILLDYDTTEEGEICLQYFMLGNGHLSFPVAATIVYGTITMPEYWSSFRKAYQRGKQSIPIQGWKWFEIVAFKTADLKAVINKNKFK